MQTRFEKKKLLPNLLASLKCSLLSRLVIYYSKSGLLRLIIKNEQIYFANQANKKNRFLVCIAARDTYSEYHKSYPITGASELRQVLAQQYDGKVVVHLISPAEGHQRQVVSYVFNASIKEQLPAISFIIPDAILLSLGLDQPRVKAEVADGAWFLFKNKEQFSSQQRSELCGDLDIFGIIQGVPENTPTEVITAKDLPAILLKGLSCLKLSLLQACFHYQKPPRVSLPWRSLIIGSSTLITSYFLFVSAYLALAIPARESQLQQLNPGMATVFTLREQLEHTEQQARALSEALGTQRSIYPTWLILKQLVDMQVTVQNIELSGTELLISGSAANAIAVLSSLTELPTTEQASFSQPTRRSRGQEAFTIRLVFKTGGNNE